MKKNCFIFVLLLWSLHNLNAQHRNLFYNLEALGGFISSGSVPFWLRSNQNGSIPLNRASLSLIGSTHKEYDNTKTRLVDWGASIQGRINIGQSSNFKLIEGYGKLRVSLIEIKAGRSRKIMGLCDSSLSSGSFSISGNSLGIPKVQIAIPEFYSLPIFGKLFAFKGSYAHGWIGETSMNNNNNIVQRETYFHQKSLYGRFGQPDWKVKLYGGINHQVFWGTNRISYMRWSNAFMFNALTLYLLHSPER